MTKITIKIILSLFIAILTITFIGSVSSCLPPDPPNIVCIEVDQDLCPNADFSNTVLDISNYLLYDYSIDQQGGPYGDGYPSPEILALISFNNKKYITEHLTSSATDKEVTYWKNRYVEGYEINFGFGQKTHIESTLSQKYLNGRMVGNQRKLRNRQLLTSRQKIGLLKDIQSIVLGY